MADPMFLLKLTCGGHCSKHKFGIKSKCIYSSELPYIKKLQVAQFLLILCSLIFLVLDSDLQMTSESQ